MWRAFKHRPTAAAATSTLRQRFLSAATTSSTTKHGTPLAERYEVGSVIHGFQVLKKQPIPEYSVTALQLQHIATKAEYLHIDTVDTNNVFSINFRTPPYSSNGISHILEHLVLCGSKRYPVRDPFFNMLKRSLNNFMNAMTASDHTMYPFATTNAKDFENLLAVYLDAAFFPTLSALDFSQEGHRVEWENSPQQQQQQLQYKGVVLNEMKGVLSDSQTLFSTRLQTELMHGSIYEHVSGGDPSTDLTTLTHDELVEFHRSKYHPSNCLFYSYGNFPLESHLDTIATSVLSQFSETTSPSPPPVVIDPLSASSFKRMAGVVSERHVTGPDDGKCDDLYIRMKFDISAVPEDLRWFIPLFSAMLGQLGTSKYKFDEIGTVLQTVNTHDTSCYSEALVVETLCLPHHVSNTLRILEQLLADTQYTTPPNLAQIKSLVLSASAAANASIASTGHSLAAYRAAMGLTSYAPAVESARGMTSIAALQQWADAIEADPAALDALGAIFRRLSALTFRRDQMGLSVVTEPHLVTQVDAELAKMTWQHHKQDDLAGRLGKGLFTRGFTHDMLQARRSQLLGVTKADLVRVATDHLANAAKSNAVVVGKEESRQELVHRGFE
ncbi:hypothetical protein DYB35_005319 [Aphanomyces astaci]|uniref:Peptidase M16C associated domain-containing protein n=2 Tax=Aphanomyces astaci TaxID=112090 RepID=A0A418CKU3_APHAT|nr:hypothetical protein DYB35_005319 [Aphanomyces astaci]